MSSQRERIGDAAKLGRECREMGKDLTTAHNILFRWFEPIGAKVSPHAALRMGTRFWSSYFGKPIGSHKPRVWEEGDST